MIRFPPDDTEHTEERVLWVQTPSGHGDMRIAKKRSDMTATATSLADLSHSQLLELAAADCSCGVCELDQGTVDAQGRPRARWHVSTTGFTQQVVSNWPEYGYLEWMSPSKESVDQTTTLDSRPCMMEYAPDGQYIEDWRLSPGSTGFSCHLTGPGRNLYVAGIHAMLAIHRTEEPAVAKPLVNIVHTDGHKNRTAVETYLSSEYSYAQKKHATADCSEFIIELSTLPWRQGQSISLQWLWNLLGPALAEKEQQVSFWQQKEGTLVTDAQGIQWTLVSIGYRAENE